MLIILIAAIGGGGSTEPTGTTGAAPAAPSSSAPSSGAGASEDSESSAAASTGVVYEVTGSGRSTSISYGANGSISQANGERLPWSETAPATDGFAIYALTAQSGSSGEITCRITVDGQEVARQTSTGQYAVVSCSGNDSGF